MKLVMALLPFVLVLLALIASVGMSLARGEWWKLLAIFLGILFAYWCAWSVAYFDGRTKR